MISLDKYDSVEFTLSAGSTDYNLDANQSNAFANVRPWKRTLIRTNVTISIKINSTSNHSITISNLDSPFEIDWQEVTNLFITNSSGNTASIKIIGVE